MNDNHWAGHCTEYNQGIITVIYSCQKIQGCVTPPETFEKWRSDHPQMAVHIFLNIKCYRQYCKTCKFSERLRRAVTKSGGRDPPQWISKWRSFFFDPPSKTAIWRSMYITVLSFQISGCKVLRRVDECRISTPPR